MAECAKRVGISRTQLSMIESQSSGASERSAIAISQVLGSTFEELFEITLPRNRTTDSDEESTPSKPTQLSLEPLTA